MSQEKHYAFLNKSNVVKSILVYRDEELPEGYASFEDYYGEAMGMRCKRACPDTLKGKHTSGGVPFRGNYPELGYVYDDSIDAFVPEKPFPSWILNTNSYSWNAPVEYPSDSEFDYVWSEKGKSWRAVSPSLD